MVNFPKTPNFHGRFSKNGSFVWQIFQKWLIRMVIFPKKILFSWEIFTYGNISVALMIIIPLLYGTSFFPCFGHNYTAGYW
jgi:hypothetical protein